MSFFDPFDSDPELVNKNILRALIHKKIRETKSVFLRPSYEYPWTDHIFYDFYDEVDGYQVQILYSLTTRLTFDKDITIGRKLVRKEKNLLIIPCFINDIPYVANIIKHKDFRIRVYVITKEEFIFYWRDVFDKGKFPPELRPTIEFCIDIISSTGTDNSLSCVDPVDEGVRTALVFFEKVHALKLEKKLRELLFMEKISGTTPDMLAMLKTSEPPIEKALMVIRELLLEEGINKEMRDRVENLFLSYIRDPANFGLENMETDVALLFIALDQDNIELEHDAARRLPDLSMVDTNSPFYRQTLKDIEAAVRKVCGSKFEDSVPESKVVPLFGPRNGGQKEKLYKTGLPVGMRVSSLSDWLLPAARLVNEEMRFIVEINENFARFMTRLNMLGIREACGDIPFATDSEGRVKNIYFSIIYSTITHIIYGHLHYSKGIFILDTDSMVAHGKRGKKNLYINLAAIVYFWFVVVEDSQRSGRDQFGSMPFSYHTKKFMDKYPALFDMLSDGEKKEFPEFFDRIRRMFSRELDLGMRDSVFSRKVLPTPALLFDIFWASKGKGSLQDILESFRLLYKHEPDRLMLIRNIDFLSEMAIIRKQYPFTGTLVKLEDALKPVYDLYEMIPLTKTSYKKIRRILLDFEKSKMDKNTRSMKAKNEILRITEPLWTETLVGEFRRAYPSSVLGAEQADTLVLALDTSWVPDTHKDFVSALIQSLDKLERISLVRVIIGTALELAKDLRQMVLEQHTSHGNIIVFTGIRNIEEGYFKFIQDDGMEGENRAFLAGIDTKHIKGECYIRIMEMLFMVLRLSNGYDIKSPNINIKILRLDSRTYIFVQAAESLDMICIKRLYEAQKASLESL